MFVGFVRWTGGALLARVRRTSRAVAWTPSDSATVLAWWDVNTGLTLVGSEIDKWTARVLDNFVVPETGASRPTLGSINGVTALHFDGTEKLTRNGDIGLPNDNNEARSVYLVGKPDDTTEVVTWVSQGLNGEPVFRLQSRPLPLGEPYFGGWTSDVAATSPVQKTTEAKQMMATFAGGAGGNVALLKLYADGVQVGSKNVNVVPTERLDFGATNWLEPLIGTLGDVVFTNGQEDAATRQKIEGYLAHKFGIASRLPADHPYKSAAPTK